MSKWVKLGNTEFNVDVLKKMSLAKFKKKYGKKYGAKTEDVYYRLSGNKKTKPKKEVE